MSEKNEFDDIRSYEDQDVKRVMKALLKARPQIRSIRKVFFKKRKFFGFFLEALLFAHLNYQKVRIKTIKDFQKKLTVPALKRVLKLSCDGLSFSGLENIEKGKGYFFIGNHRDIILDAALLSFNLLQNQFDTCYFAFGDNLIEKDFFGDLLRINKGFVVRRNLPLRELFKSSEHLSCYINHLLENNCSLWIAQRNGRSKDGTDETKPTVLKMLSFMDRRKKIPFSQTMKRFHIVPVSIAYEYDPCDRMKAKELASLEEFNEYKKKPYEDLNSIFMGIKGQKGRIHLAIGKEIEIPEMVDENHLAHLIDLEIHKNYHLWSSNFAAYDLIHAVEKFRSQYSDQTVKILKNRMEGLTEKEQYFLLLQYANPVENQIKEGVLQ